MSIQYWKQYTCSGPIDLHTSLFPQHPFLLHPANFMDLLDIGVILLTRVMGTDRQMQLMTTFGQGLRMIRKKENNSLYNQET